MKKEKDSDKNKGKNNKIYKNESWFKKVKKGFGIVNQISNWIRVYDFLENHKELLDTKDILEFIKNLISEKMDL